MRFVILISLLLACDSPVKIGVPDDSDFIVEIDADGDGYLEGDDCDDDNSSVFPGAVEVCDAIDNNCNQEIDEGVSSSFYLDIDEDGFGNSDEFLEACEAPEGYVPNGNDCDDDNSAIFPGNIEICDDIDNNCDANIDEGVGNTYYADDDDDGYGDPNDPTLACDLTEGLVDNSDDCDDGNNTIYLGATENCDSLDNDCDGDVDEDGETLYYLDADGDGYGDSNNSILSCANPSNYVTVGEDCDDIDPLINPNAIEICDGLDNNCDDNIDDSTSLGQQTFYADSDGDGFGDPDSSADSCSQPLNMVSDDSDCDDGEFNVNPDSTEICDGLDNDCDTLLDADDPSLSNGTLYGLDLDGDGFGSPVVTTTDCSQPAGYVADASDCNDLLASVYPGANEVCDGLDNDCDGFEDDGESDTDPSTFTNYYPDNDGDGYGDSASVTAQCDQPMGYILDGSDCDDTDPSINPLMVWYADADGDSYGNISYQSQSCLQPTGYVADGTDCNDGDSSVNPDSIWYIDIDGDGFGTAAYFLAQCQSPSGYVLNDSDCDDGDLLVNPNATEVCDGLDNDCDGDVDDDDSSLDSTSASLWYEDQDGDGFGDALIFQSGCVQPSGYLLDDNDCDDNDASINPNGTEICDGLDNDCDGIGDPSSLLGTGSTCPGLSCLDILNSAPSSVNDTYWIDPLGGSPFEAYCDMSSDGGGWTLLGTVYGGDQDNWNTEHGYWSDGNTLGNVNSPWEDYKSQAWIDLDISSAEILWQRRYGAVVHGQAVLASDCQDSHTYFTDLFTTWDTTIGCGTSSITVLQSSAIGTYYPEGSTYGIAGFSTNGWCWNGGDTASNTFQGHAGWNQSAYGCYGIGHLGYIGVFSKGSSQYQIEDITTTNWLYGVSDYEQTAVSFFSR